MHRLPLGHRAHRLGGTPLEEEDRDEPGTDAPARPSGRSSRFALAVRRRRRRSCRPGSPGAIRLHGRVLDGAGEPVPDALLEIWQADADGLVVQRSGSLRRDGYTFTGWGRAATDRTGTTRSPR